jgi:monoamine oxidase
MGSASKASASTGLSRRAAMFAAAGTMLSGAARAASHDVVVVGAGAAGIGAARELQRLGKQAVVLEARQRLGGRTYTDTSLGQPFDAGAAYIHFSADNPWTGIARELGVEALGGYRLWRGSTAYINGRPLTPEEADRRWRAMGKVSDAMSEVSERRDESFASAVRHEDEDVRNAARARAHLATGEEPEYVSVADFERLDGGNDLVVPDGYGTLVARYGEGLDVRLGTRVTGIDWSGPLVEIDTDKGRLTARAVIITVSIGVLQAGAIRMAPRLPAATRDALAGLRMGALSKVALRFGDPEGAPKRPEGEGRFGLPTHAFMQDIGDAQGPMTFEAWPHGRDLVIAHFGGNYARELARLGEAAAVDAVLERFVRIVGADARKALVGGRHAAWPTDPLALGGYAVALPGRTRAREALAERVGDRLWFAGEATAGSASMTAGGATLAGRRAAREIVAKLGNGVRR